MDQFSQFIDQYWEILGTVGGTLVILGIGILVFLVVAIILEHRTRTMFPDRKGGSGLFDFDDDEDDDKD